MPREAQKRGYWTDGDLPANVQVGDGTVISGGMAFQRFRGDHRDALKIGQNCTIDGPSLAVGKTGRLTIGDYCYLMAPILLCEVEIQIGSYVVIGWNTTIADTDFHPIGPAERIADAIAIARGGIRPLTERKPVVIEDDVWIGPSATILKGVSIGRGSYIEAGSVVTKSVPPMSRVVGNPAQVVGKVGA